MHPDLLLISHKTNSLPVRSLSFEPNPPTIMPPRLDHGPMLANVPSVGTSAHHPVHVAAVAMPHSTREVTVTASAPTTGGSSSRISVPRSHSIRDVEMQSSSMLDLPEGWTGLLQNLTPDALNHIHPGALSMHIAPGFSFLPGQTSDASMSLFPDTTMPVYDSPRPMSLILPGFLLGEGGPVLSNMSTTSANGSGSAGAGRTSPQLRVQHSAGADARHLRHGLVAHERGFGRGIRGRGGRGSSRTSTPPRGAYNTHA